MAVVQELIRLEENQSISFGNYLVNEKKKVIDFEVNGDLYKVKTYNEITKLEKNGKLVFESLPGTAVHHFDMKEKIVSFELEGEDDVSVTLELEGDKNYKIFIDDVQVDKVKSNLAGKVTFSADVQNDKKRIRIEKM